MRQASGAGAPMSWGSLPGCGGAPVSALERRLRVLWPDSSLHLFIPTLGLTSSGGIAFCEEKLGGFPRKLVLGFLLR